MVQPHPKHCSVFSVQTTEPPVGSEHVIFAIQELRYTDWTKLTGLVGIYLAFEVVFNADMILIELFNLPLKNPNFLSLFRAF